jgi:hypothetical protein
VQNKIQEDINFRGKQRVNWYSPQPKELVIVYAYKVSLIHSVSKVLRKVFTRTWPEADYLENKEMLHIVHHYNLQSMYDP